jgi:hypothetical protein
MERRAGTRERQCPSSGRMPAVLIDFGPFMSGICRDRSIGA